MASLYNNKVSVSIVFLNSRRKNSVLKNEHGVFMLCFRDAHAFFAFFESAKAVMNAVIGIERITPMLLEIPLMTSMER